MAKSARPRDCPCFSGERYAACCAPLHRGEREASSPEALMRSRYAAFALGLGEYLVRTLAADHPDRGLPHAAFVQELSRAHERKRFMGLRILHAVTSGSAGEVMFHARIFEKGADQSFVELSQFARESGGWRYRSGIVIPKADLPEALETLVPEQVRRLGTVPDAE
jgi:SEC-C motif domain protein